MTTLKARPEDKVPKPPSNVEEWTPQDALRFLLNPDPMPGETMCLVRAIELAKETEYPHTEALRYACTMREAAAALIEAHLGRVGTKQESDGVWLAGLIRALPLPEPSEPSEASVERVARAIGPADYRHLSQAWKEPFRKKARAAIQALAAGEGEK